MKHFLKAYGQLDGTKRGGGPSGVIMIGTSGAFFDLTSPDMILIMSQKDVRRESLARSPSGGWNRKLNDRFGSWPRRGNNL